MFDVYVNGTKELELDSFGSIEIIGDFSVGGGTGGTSDSDVSDGTTGGDTDSGDEDPVDSGDSIDDPDETVPENVHREYDFAWDDGESDQLRIIPQGKILSSKFFTGPGTGTIDIEVEQTTPYTSYDMWISNTPGGPALDHYHALRDNVSFKFGIPTKYGVTESTRNVPLNADDYYYCNWKVLSGAKHEFRRWIILGDNN